MLEIIENLDIRNMMTNELKDKNLTITVFKGNKQITSEYALIDGVDYGKVFKDFSRDVIGYLAIALEPAEQTENLKFVVKRNNEVVYEFTSTYKVIRKGISDTFRKKANQKLIDAKIVAYDGAVKHSLNTIIDETDTLGLLDILSNVAKKADKTNITANEYLKMLQVENKVAEAEADGEIFQAEN